MRSNVEKTAAEKEKFDITEKDSLQKQSGHTMGTLLRLAHSMQSGSNHCQTAV
jgi:hypothetical protein